MNIFIGFPLFRDLMINSLSKLRVTIGSPVNESFVEVNSPFPLFQSHYPFNAFHRVSLHQSSVLSCTDLIFSIGNKKTRTRKFLTVGPAHH